MHTAVRERELPDGHVHAAVYPGVPEGDYVIPARGALPAVAVTIRGGEVTEVVWAS